jgi:hypothetical protein
LNGRTGAELLAAFSAASGIPAETLVDAMRLALAAIVLIWFAWAASRIGAQALRHDLAYRKAWGYILRAAVLTTLVLLVLTP